MFVAIAVTLSIGLQVIGNMQDSIAEDDCAARTDGNTTYNATAKQCHNGSFSNPVNPDTYGFNSTEFGLEAGDELASWLPTIALIVAAAVIIGVIVVYLARRFQ